MQQRIDEKHECDVAGCPAGGETMGTGTNIRGHHGPLARGPDRRAPSGAFVEGVIAAALGRILFYEKAAGGRFSCRENSFAIMKLEEALHWLNARTVRREAHDVEGTYAA